MSQDRVWQFKDARPGAEGSLVLLDTLHEVVGPADVDAAMEAGDLHADGIREQLPTRAEVVHTAVAEFASRWWEQEIRRVIQQNPVRAMENAERFGQLKEDLRQLQSSAMDVARARYAATFSAESVDARVAAILRGPFKDPDGVLTDPLTPRFWEEPLRFVLGEVGDALGRAGLTNSSAMSLDPTAAIDPQGRYRYALEMSPELVEATAQFDAVLGDLAMALTDIEKLKQEKMRQRALALWDDA